MTALGDIDPNVSMFSCQHGGGTQLPSDLMICLIAYSAAYLDYDVVKIALKPLINQFRFKNVFLAHV